MKRNVHLLLYILIPVLGFAQRGEVRLPLLGNPVLQEYAASHPEAFPQALPVKKLGKAANAGNFPFISLFDYATDTLDQAAWIPTGAKKSGRSVVFNAQNAAGNTYNGGSGAFGAADSLRSNFISTYGSNGNLYITFQYSTGSTWSSGDSLVLQAQTPSGTYNTLWSSPNVAIDPTEIFIAIPLALYQSSSFAFQFICYTASNATNTRTFTLHYVALADKWALPAYDDFTARTLKGDTIFTDTFPSDALWFRKQTSIRSRAELKPVSSAVAVFDAFDDYGHVYGNGNGTNGYADTLYSHAIDVQSFDPADSVYLRFFYKAMPNVTASDSLILEFRNNVGQWLRVWQAGASASVRDTFIRQINTGRYRHSNFQFRLIGKCTYLPTDTLKFLVTGINIGRRIALPFLDDFSTTELYPSQKLWTSKHVYINNHFPIRQPSYNVATFDGLDSRGNPYGSGTGFCDTLCSYPINMSGYSPKDSVYLSFWFEPQGNGDTIANADSLVLEFRGNAAQPGQYRRIWSSGKSVPTYRFTEVRIALLDSSFFHDDFQFRFKNISSLTGNLDQWHVDYVRLDRGRSYNDFYKDAAVTTVPASLLQTYTAMPKKHYLINPSAFTDSVQLMSLRNNSDQSLSVNTNRFVFDQAGGQVDAYNNIIPSMPAAYDTTVRIAKRPVLPVQSFSTDSIVFNSVYAIAIGGGNDNIPSNDTAKVQTIFSNYFAYDDGSAEAGYAVKNVTGSVALGYTLQVQDTLVGISMFFNRSSTDVSSKSFNLMVWQNVNSQGGGVGETVLKRVLFGSPIYTNKINGFYYYKFDHPIVLPAGRFYIGWEQTQVFELNVGLDQNYMINDVPGVNPNMWFKIDGIWERTSLTGALMMRPLFGKWLTPPVGINEAAAEKEQLDALIYPNPASDRLYIHTASAKVLDVQVLDMNGKLMLGKTCSGKDELQLPDLAPGFYLVRITDTDKGYSTTKKLIISK